MSRIIVPAVETGYTAPDGDGGFVQQLRNNAEVFSAFKAHRMGRDMASQLLDDDGNVKPFEQFRKDTEGIVSHHVKQWLRTEYDTAIRRAHRAAEMRQFIDEADVFPNIEWLPSTAVNPREEHMPFYHHVWAIDDPFWEHHKPGDEWGCQCGWESTDDPVTDNTGLDDESIAPPSPGLGGNPAKTGQVFSDDHPYFPSDCTHCAFYKPGIRDRLAYIIHNVEPEKDCNSCPYIRACINKLDNRAELIKRNKRKYLGFKKDKNYKDVEFDEKTGAVKATSVNHNVQTADQGNETYFGDEKLTGTALEKECQSEIFRMGHSCILEAEGITGPNQNNPRTSLDTTTDWRRMDIRSITAMSEHYRNAILSKNKQIRKFNELSPEIMADSLILYFHDPAMYSANKVLLGYEKALKFQLPGQDRPIDMQVKHIICVVRGAADWYVFDFE